MDEIESLLERGAAYVKQGNLRDAIDCYEEGMAFAHNAESMSLYAYCVAAEEKRFENAVSLAMIALQKELDNPEVYLNIGRVFILCERRELAVKALKRGLDFDQYHRGIWTELKSLGEPGTGPMRQFFGHIYAKLRALLMAQKPAGG